MIEAPKSKNENERLKTLFEYDILDTEAEKTFDDLTHLAAEICGTPISLISLVDPDRQWFKSKVGLDADQTEREIAFCSHAILQDELFEIQNALLDERFHDNPLVTSDPNIRFYAGTQLKAPNGQNIGTLCVISDSPKQLNESQKRALTLLGREVIAQLELRLKNKKLEIATKHKSAFLSNVSHDIRTPLNAILGLSEISLNNKEFKKCFADEYACIEQIQFSGKQLLSLVNTILDLSKIEAGKMELEITQCELPTYINNLYKSLKNEAEKKNIEFKLTFEGTIPDIVMIDQTKLGQLITNIAGNAIKFTAAGKSIDLLLTTDANFLTITIIDQGVGIKKEDQELLFNEFTQVGDSKKQQQGTGLGLAITQSLVNLMGGTISLSSQLNIGTKVSMKLPFDIPTDLAQMSQDSSINLVGCESLRVLVVEDNEVNQMVISAMLKSLNINFDVVDDGESALEQYNKADYDVTLMDINLPGMNGIETTLAASRKGVNGFFVALTADVYCTKDDKEAFDFFLTKPIVIDNLKQLFSQVLAEGKSI